MAREVDLNETPMVLRGRRSCQCSGELEGSPGAYYQSHEVVPELRDSSLTWMAFQEAEHKHNDFSNNSILTRGEGVSAGARWGATG